MDQPLPFRLGRGRPRCPGQVAPEGADFGARSAWRTELPRSARAAGPDLGSTRASGSLVDEAAAHVETARFDLEPAGAGTDPWPVRVGRVGRVQRGCPLLLLPGAQ